MSPRHRRTLLLKISVAELTVENETLRNRCAELSTEVVSAWGTKRDVGRKNIMLLKGKETFTEKNWQEYKYIKFELEGSFWVVV